MLKLATNFAAVLIGSQGARYLEMVPLKLIAGLGSIAIGARARRPVCRPPGRP